MAFFLGIDLGASRLKATLINAVGQKIATCAAPIATAHPQAGYAEQNPDDWRTALIAALAEMKANHAQDFSAIAAMSISGGAHIAVLCDRQARPIRPAILWSDQRATREARALQAEGEAERVSGNRPNPTWVLPQLLWLKTHAPQSLAQCARLYFAKDWLRGILTDTWQSDCGEAVGAMLYNNMGLSDNTGLADDTSAWSAPLIAKTGLEEAVLPPLAAPHAEAGRITANAAASTGLAQGLPVYQGTIDTSVEWLCCAPLTPQSASLKLASAGVVAISHPTGTPHPPLSLYPHVLAGAVYYAAGMNQCVSAVQWVRRVLLRNIPQNAMEALAQSVDAGSHNVLFHPYLAGERAPLWQADLTASLCGLTRASDRATIARAAYEGVGFAFMDIWQDVTARLHHRPDALHLLGGGAQSDFWCQMLADMLNVPLHRGRERDASFGSALLAATAHGAFASLTEAAEAGYQRDTIFIPDTRCHSRYGEAHTKFQLWRET